MKKIKKITALTSTAAILASMAVMPVASVQAENTLLFSDDIESHALYEQVGTKAEDIENDVPSYAVGYGGGKSDTMVEGYWATSAALGGEGWYNDYRVRYDLLYGNGYNDKEEPTTNKTIALTPSSAKEGYMCALNLIYDVGEAENYKYSVDVRNTYEWSQTPVAGIRLADPEDDTNYYEVALITPQTPENYVYQQYEGAKEGSLPPRFTRVEGANGHTAAIAEIGSEPDEWTATAYSEENAVTMLHNTGDGLKTTWFTLTITKVGDTICWSVIDKQRDITVWEASFADETPLFDGMGTLQLFAYGSGANNTVFFDNVTLETVDADTELPSPAPTVAPTPESTATPEPTATPIPTVTPVPTPKTPLKVFSDDMENHAVYVLGDSKADDINNDAPSYATGYGGNVSDVMVEGYWATSATLGGTNWYNDYCIQYDELTGNGYANNDKAPIRYSGTNPDTSNKVIALQPSYNEKGQLCVLNLTSNVGTAEDFVYSVDVRNYFRGTVNPVAGIRLADPTDDTSYYELALISEGDNYEVDHEGAKFAKPRFTKVEAGSTHTAAVAAEGAEPAEWKYTDYGSVGTASGMYKNDGYRTTWFTLTIAKVGDTIYWSIIDKAFNEVVWIDSFKDDSALFNGMGRLQLFAYGAGKCDMPTFFDNVDLKKVGTALYMHEEVAGTFTDDLESNTVGTSPADWSASEKFNSGAAYSVKNDRNLANDWGGDADYDLEDKVIQMYGNGGHMAINYNTQVANTYSVDMRNYLMNGATNPVMGIRISDLNNEANYYELALISDTTYRANAGEAAIAPPRFMKVKGADTDTPAVSDTIPEQCLYSDNGTEKTSSGAYVLKEKGGYGTTWFTLELGKTGNDVSFKVSDKTTGSVLWSKTWTDSEPLFEGAGKLQVFTYGGSSAVLVNNVSGEISGDKGLRLEASWIKDNTDAPFIMLADYDADNKVVALEKIDAQSGSKGYYASPSSLSMSGTTKKAFMWDGETMKAIAAPAQYQEGDIESCVVTFPNYSTKAATFSLDDGNPNYDPAVVELMKKYDIKGTYNLTGYALTEYDIYKHENFEVANHTTHIEMYTGEFTYEECVASMEEASVEIQARMNTVPVGLVWPYQAPKSLSFWPELYAYANEHYEYARETGETCDFSVPLDWMQWTATAWSNNWRTYTDKFMAAEYTDELQILALAGHAFDEPEGEESMTALCDYVFAQVASDNRIWKATNIEVCKYTKAAKALEITSKNVYNPSEDTAVYMIIDGNQYVAQPQSYAQPLN